MNLQIKNTSKNKNNPTQTAAKMTDFFAKKTSSNPLKHYTPRKVALLVVITCLALNAIYYMVMMPADAAELIDLKNLGAAEDREKEV